MKLKTLLIFQGGFILRTKKGNNYVIDEANNIAKIELHRRKAENLWTIIDLEDLERVINFPYTWFAKYNKPIDDYYACASEYHPELQQSRPIHLHQFIMETRDNHVDHINHNPRDNRKENLRVILPNENLRNREGKNSNNKSGYRNVSWDGSAWVVQLQVNGQNKCLGRFKSDELELAAKFAEEMRNKYYGVYAGNG